MTDRDRVPADSPRTLDSPVTFVQYRDSSDGPKDIYIVGTAHISQRSVEDVRRTIDEVQPDTVCVELDPVRHEFLTDPTRWRKLDIFQVIKDRKVLLLMASLVLSAYQRRLGQALGVQPGAEMLMATREAERLGAKLVFADRDIQATLKRAWRGLSFWNKTKVVGSLVASIFAMEEISDEQVEQLKDRDHLSDAMRQFAQAMPQLTKPLIDERDRYLIASVREAPGDTIVAVVGAGHVAGMVAALEEPIDRKELARIPPPSPWSHLWKWVLPAVVLAAFYWGWREHAADGLQRMLFAWVLPNSIVAALFAIAAGARLLTILTSLVASPITSLNPTLGAGMVAGLVEAWLRKPTVEDCERMPEDSKTLRGIYRNQFTRVLLVAVLVTAGSAIGGWVGATWVVSLL